MAIPIKEIEGIIEEAEQGHFSIDDLRDIVAKYRKKDDELADEMYGFKEQLWHEAIYDESENVVNVEAFPGDKKREKQVFLISCDLVDEIYEFFVKHGRPQSANETN